jgi:uncharacterized repeat protein (TIGR02543 family)
MSLRIFLAICFLMLAIIVVIIILSSKDFNADNMQASAVSSLSSKYSLQVNKTGAGSGTIKSDPAGISCGNTCKASFAKNSSVNLTASPSSGSTFAGWSGSCSGMGNCNVTMKATRSVTARFNASYLITVKKGGTGSGVVTGPNINCGTDCNESYNKGISITLTATPDSGSTFTGWSGCSRTSNKVNCILNVTTAKTVTATFKASATPPTLTVNKTGPGSGIVTGSGINCGTDCTEQFTAGKSITLKAVADSGSTFASWLGCNSVSGKSCIVKMTSSKTVTAAFTKNISDQSKAKVTVSGTGSGTVYPKDSVFGCTSSCSYSYQKGASATFTAVPSSGSKFTGWEGDCSGTGTSCTVIMDQDKEITANFATNANVISGALNVSVVPSPTTPVAGQLVMGSSDNTFLVLVFSADPVESIKISKIVITDGSIFGGSINNVKLFSVGSGYSTPIQIGSTVASLSSEINGKAVFNLDNPWVIPANTTYYLVVKAGVNQYPNAVSGGVHILSILSTPDIDSYGVNSGTLIKETGIPVSSNGQDVYRTKFTVSKNASSPSGVQVAGANAEVLRFDVAVNSNYSGYLGAVALTLSGSTDLSSNGDAKLYDYSDMADPLAIEAYKAPVCSSGTTDLTVSDTTGIPVGANVMISINGTVVTREVTKVASATSLTINSPVAACDGTTDYVYYRPLQPGTGKLYFGAETIFRNNLSNSDNHVEVVSTDGFAVGDKITFRGYNSSNQMLTGTATVTGLSDNDIYFSDGVTITGSSNTTIIADQTSDKYDSTGGAKIVKTNTPAIVYVGTSLNGSIGDMLNEGTTATYIVKGDTTGATTNEMLKADIYSTWDFLWSDTSSLMIRNNNVTFPLTGGTLTY